jgi:4-alpha-glucanotransferase
LVERAGGEQGADLIGLNPLHALKNRRPYHISPYSPNSRLYVNELYLDVGRLAEGASSSEVTELIDNEEFSSWLETLRKAESVDYDAVADAKRRVVERAFQQFLRVHLHEQEGCVSPATALGREFLDFVESEGEPLRLYAVHEMLAEHIQRRVPTVWSWRDWPDAYRSPRSAEVAAIARQRWSRVLFFQYVQWQLGRQLAEVQALTKQVGMGIGLYHDLALGSDLNGADGWMYQEALALDAECGAPPDAFAPEGQNWGFAPFDPLRLRGSGYQPYIDLLRHTLRHGGAIRIDHVMGLFRLFWIPKGSSASAGTYVHYPSDDLLAILALESHRARCLVIGEDLGTVPDWVRDQLAKVSILSYKVFYFERTWEGACKPPQWYPPMSVAVVTTHDLATLSGFWAGEDLAVRAKLGLFPDARARRQAEEARQRDKKDILQALEKEGLLPAGLTVDPASVPTMSSELARAIHAYLAKAPTWVMLVNVDDLLGEVRQMNVPGTVTEYPNWSRKLPVGLEQIWEHSRLKMVVSVLRDFRPRR